MTDHAPAFLLWMKLTDSKSYYRKSAERDGQTRRDRCSDKDLLSVAQLTQYRVSFPQGHFSVY